jgi:hypothetical protein
MWPQQQADRAGRCRPPRHQPVPATSFPSTAWTSSASGKLASEREPICIRCPLNNRVGLCRQKTKQLMFALDRRALRTAQPAPGCRQAREGDPGIPPRPSRARALRLPRTMGANWSGKLAGRSGRLPVLSRSARKRALIGRLALGLAIKIAHEPATIFAGVLAKPQRRACRSGTPHKPFAARAPSSV